MGRPYKFGDVVKDWHELHWSSDWNGDEVGYDEIPVIGLYEKDGWSYYVNSETGEVVEAWQDEEGEE